MEFKLFEISVVGLINSRLEIWEENRLLYWTKKRNVLGIFDFDIYNDVGDMVYSAMSHLFTIPSKFSLKKDNQVVARMQGKLFSKSIDISLNDNQKFELKGKLLSREFELFRGDQAVAKLSEKILKRKGRYGLAIAASENVDLIVAIILLAIQAQRLRRRSN